MRSGGGRQPQAKPPTHALLCEVVSSADLPVWDHIRPIGSGIGGGGGGGGGREGMGKERVSNFMGRGGYLQFVFFFPLSRCAFLNYQGGYD